MCWVSISLLHPQPGSPPQGWSCTRHGDAQHPVQAAGPLGSAQDRWYISTVHALWPGWGVHQVVSETPVSSLCLREKIANTESQDCTGKASPSSAPRRPWGTSVWPGAASCSRKLQCLPPHRFTTPGTLQHPTLRHCVSCPAAAGLRETLTPKALAIHQGTPFLASSRENHA